MPKRRTPADITLYAQRFLFSAEVQGDILKYDVHLDSTDPATLIAGLLKLMLCEPEAAKLIVGAATAYLQFPDLINKN